MYANASPHTSKRARKSLRESLAESRIYEQILVVTGIVAICVVSRLPSLLALGVPRVLAITGALIVGICALLVLCHAVARRLFPGASVREMDATELQLLRYYHRLLDESSLNPLRRLS